MILFVYWTEVSSLDVRHEANARFSLFASAIAALGLSLPLFLEQQRLYQLSGLATRYLLVSVLCDVVYLTMPSDIAKHATISRPVLLRCCMQSALLVFEYGTQRCTLDISSPHRSPKELHGLFGRLLFLWINPILLWGYKETFTQTDMPPLDHDMMPESTRKVMVDIWSQRGQPGAPSFFPPAHLLTSHWTSQTRNAEEFTPSLDGMPENPICRGDCTATSVDYLPLFSAHLD
jgi:hypothetical protein